MQFKKIIAALDFSDVDDAVANYIKYLSQIVSMEKIYFMHIIKSLTKPEHAALEFQKFFNPDVPLDEHLKSEMKKNVQKVIPPASDLEQIFEVHEGNPVEKMLHWAEIKNIDLVVFGRKNKSLGSGLTPRRMAHRLNANMLFVPEKIKTPIRKVVVPLDYSEHSLKAIEHALSLRKQIPDLQIIALHIIEMFAVDHYPDNTAYQSYTSLMKEANVVSYNKMLARTGIEEGELEKVFIDNSPHTIPRAIREYLKDNPCDLVIIGAQGHSRIRNFFYGSTTESFIDSYASSPVLIIR